MFTAIAIQIEANVFRQLILIRKGEGSLRNESESCCSVQDLKNVIQTWIFLFNFGKMVFMLAFCDPLQNPSTREF